MAAAARNLDYRKQLRRSYIRITIHWRWSFLKQDHDHGVKMQSPLALMSVD
jgi:hypothetical protein